MHHYCYASPLFGFKTCLITMDGPLAACEGRKYIDTLLTRISLISLSYLTSSAHALLCLMFLLHNTDLRPTRWSHCTFLDMILLPYHLKMLYSFPVPDGVAKEGHIPILVTKEHHLLRNLCKTCAVLAVHAHLTHDFNFEHPFNSPTYFWALFRFLKMFNIVDDS